MEIDRLIPYCDKDYDVVRDLAFTYEALIRIHNIDNGWIFLIPKMKKIYDTKSCFWDGFKAIVEFYVEKIPTIQNQGLKKELESLYTALQEALDKDLATWECHALLFSQVRTLNELHTYCRMSNDLQTARNKRRFKTFLKYENKFQQIKSNRK